LNEVSLSNRYFKKWFLSEIFVLSKKYLTETYEAVTKSDMTFKNDETKPNSQKHNIEITFMPDNNNMDGIYINSAEVCRPY
jgi:hypothetical protein